MGKVVRQKRINIINQMTVRRWGVSLVAAGVLISVLNISSPNFNIGSFVGDFYRGSVKINRSILEPFRKAALVLDYSNKSREFNYIFKN